MSSENQNWVLGVTLGLLGSIAINTGNNIQSLGLKRLQSQQKVEPEPSAVAHQKKTPSPLLPSLPWIRRKAGENPANERKLSLPWLSPPNARISATSNEESEFVDVNISWRAASASCQCCIQNAAS